MTPKIKRLIEEWDREMKEHGEWTSGHSIAVQMAKALTSLSRQLAEAQQQRSTPETARGRDYYFKGVRMPFPSPPTPGGADLSEEEKK